MHSMSHLPPRRATPNRPTMRDRAIRTIFPALTDRGLAFTVLGIMQLEPGHLSGPLNAEIIVGSEEDLPEVESAYVGSELADLLDADLFNVLLVTNQDSSEILRVCGDTDVVAILYTSGQRPKGPDTKKAAEMGIAVFSTALNLKAVHGVLKKDFPEIVLKDAT